MIIGLDGRYAEGNLVGIGKYIKNLVLGLAKKKYSCYIFYSKKPKEMIRGSHPVVLKSSNRYVFEQILLPLALRKYKVDLYHATGNIGIPLFTSIPTVLTIHDIIPFEVKGYFNRSAFPILSKLSYALRVWSSCSRAKRIITITRFVKNQLIKTLGISESKIDVINSGVNIEMGKGELPRGIKKGEYILNHGGIDIRKNQERLIKAFFHVEKKFPELKLVITGDNPVLKLKLEMLSQSLGLSKNVIFTGFVSERVLWELIRNARCIVYPSLSEGFGLPVLEGFASGIPVITSNTSCLPEVSQGASLLINPLNINEISSSIIKIISDRNYAADLIKRGREVYKTYNWEMTIKKTIAVYMKILQ